jgi:hypothetical protein
MADKDERVKTETAEPIADEHEDVRRRFVELWNERTSGDAGTLAAAWQPVATLLENHASAQADVGDPALLREAEARRPCRPLVLSQSQSTQGTIQAPGTPESGTPPRAVTLVRAATRGGLAFRG